MDLGPGRSLQVDDERDPFWRKLPPTKLMTPVTAWVGSLGSKTAYWKWNLRERLLVAGLP